MKRTITAVLAVLLMGVGAAQAKEMGIFKSTQNAITQKVATEDINIRREMGIF